VSNLHCPAAKSYLSPLLPDLMSPSGTGRFMGRQLKLGQAFSLACLIEFGPLLPIESSGHLQERKALFRSAAWYCLSEEELEEVLEHKEVAQFLYSLVNYAKQYKYAIFKQARAYFGNSILCAARPRAPVQGEFWSLRTLVQGYDSDAN